MDLLQIALDPLLLLPSFNGNSLSESWHAMLLSILRSIFCEPHAGFYHTGINKWKVYHNLIKKVLKMPFLRFDDQTFLVVQGIQSLISSCKISLMFHWQTFPNTVD